jgi:hypothetical protein
MSGEPMMVGARGLAATGAEEAKSPRAANGVASSAGTTTVRKSDLFSKLNALAPFLVPLLLGTQLMEVRAIFSIHRTVLQQTLRES